MLSISRICGLIIHTQMAYKEENSRRHIILVGVILFIEIQCVSKHLIFFPHEIFSLCCIKNILFDFPPSQKLTQKKYYEENGKKKKYKVPKGKMLNIFLVSISFHPILPIYIFYTYIYILRLSFTLKLYVHF